MCVRHISIDRLVIFVFFFKFYKRICSLLYYDEKLINPYEKIRNLTTSNNFEFFSRHVWPSKIIVVRLRTQPIGSGSLFADRLGLQLKCFANSDVLVHGIIRLGANLFKTNFEAHFSKPIHWRMAAKHQLWGINRKISSQRNPRFDRRLVENSPAYRLTRGLPLNRWTRQTS